MSEIIVIGHQHSSPGEVEHGTMEDDILFLSQVAGDQAAQFEGWYKKIDPSGSGTIQAGPAAGFLKKSGLNDNVLSRVGAVLSTI